MLHLRWLDVRVKIFHQKFTAFVLLLEIGLTGKRLTSTQYNLSLINGINSVCLFVCCV